MANKISNIKIVVSLLILALFLLVGGIYAFLSHETHITLGIDLGLEHTTHLIIGYSLIVIGIIIASLALFTDSLKKVNKYGQKYWYLFLIWDMLKWILIVVFGLIVLGGGVKVGQSILGG